MAEYITMQKKALRGFLQKHSDRAYTVEELIESMQNEFKTEMPGKSTVYRLITKMLEEGSVKKFPQTGSRRFVYQAVECGKCSQHLHLKCTSCGKLLHMNHEVSDKILNQVKSDAFFEIDEEETVLMGVCTDCKGDKR